MVTSILNAFWYLKRSNKELVIISHTPHFKRNDGVIIGFGPTVREIDYLSKWFKGITHLAPMYVSKPDESYVPYESDIKYVPLPIAEGSSFFSKIKSIWFAPKIISKVFGELGKSKIFQFRAPTGMGVYLIPLLQISKIYGWFKYAGNWVQERPPLSYKIQKWFLKGKYRNRKVTINGYWGNEKSHLLSFENPTLTEVELQNGRESLRSKDFSGRLQLLFVGRIEREKGLGRMLSAIELLPESHKSFISRIYVIGSGKDLQRYKSKQYNIPVQPNFLGAVSREILPDIYSESHFLILPTNTSEGFPKVIAEASAFGCIPIVTSISSIGHYINEDNGYILNSLDEKAISKVILDAIDAKNVNNQKSERGAEMAVLFTYRHYTKRILTEIIER